MAETSGISWTDATFNPWIGCTKVSPACDHCFAASYNERYRWVDGWGAGVPRHRTSEQNWNNPRRWDRKAAASGKPLNVFCASLADVFDNEVPQQWRNDLWALIETTPNLRWILLTKRIGNVGRMIPRTWIDDEWPDHVGLMATIVDQKEWDRDFWKLEIWQSHAPWIGVSVEPILGLIDIGDARPDWIITGGESGKDRRDQCTRNRIAFHHKQNGGLRGKEGGCLIDGVEHKYFPSALSA